MEVRRYDGKLDNFLLQTLPEDEYERIATSELCVVVSPEEKPAHKHAIVGHQHLYLTQFPPKNLKIALHLQDVTSVRMLDDLPDFLSGKEREGTTHVQIKYRRVSKEGRGLRTATSDMVAPPPSSPSSSPKSSRGGLTRKSPGQPSSLSSVVRTSPEQGSVPGITPGSSTNSLYFSSTTQLTNTSSPLPARALPPTPPGLGPSPPLMSLRNTIAGSSSSLASSSSGARHSPSLLRRVGEEGSSPTLLPPAAPTSSRQSSSSPRVTRSALSLSPPTAEGVVTPPLGEVAVVDLYVLKPNTDFYHHIATAWEDHKIVSTLRPNNTRPPTSTPLPHEHFSRHFCALKGELLAPHLAPQGGTRLALELSTACQKYFVLKTLFWENAELINFCAEQLSANVCREDNGTTPEHLKYRAALMDLVYQMMGGTHICPRRQPAFVSNRGLLLLSLATASVQQITPDTSNALIEKSCGVLYELLRVAQQARWPLAERSVVCVSWLVDALASLTNMKMFCSCMVSYIAHVLGAAEATSGDLPTSTLVSLYHMASIVNTLVHESPAMAELFWSHFAEEFRYYISISGAQRYLPPNYPLRTDTLELLQSAKTKIIHHSRTVTGVN